MINKILESKLFFIFISSATVISTLLFVVHLSYNEQIIQNIKEFHNSGGTLGYVLLNPYYLKILEYNIAITMLMSIVYCIKSCQYHRKLRKITKNSSKLALYLIALVFFLGILDLFFKIFGHSDTKHLFYYFLAVLLTIFVAVKVRSVKTISFLVIGLLIHTDHILCEYNFTNEESYLMLISDFVYMKIINPELSNSLHLIYQTLLLENEYIAGRNVIAYFYMLFFGSFYFDLTNKKSSSAFR